MGYYEDEGGLDRETLLAVIEDMAQAMREAEDYGVAPVCNALSDCGSARNGSALPHQWPARLALVSEVGGGRLKMVVRRSRAAIYKSVLEARALQRSRLDPVLAGHRSARKQIR